MEIIRIYQDLEKKLEMNKVLVIYGPRQVGKTTLLKQFLIKTSLKYRFETGENLSISIIFSEKDFKKIVEFGSGFDLIVIDEAQKIPNIGEGLKIIVDQVPGIKIIVTGSSSFDLAGQVGEPLTGRKRTLYLYPVSYLELLKQTNPFDLKQELSQLLIYGSYPEVITTESKKKKREIIEEIMNSYLLKDILEFDKVRNSKLLLDLLRLISFQVGFEVSLSELGTQIGIDYKTVARYLDLLEKSFVLYNLRGYSRNLRSEITNKSKYYFYDLGVRNAIISSFNPLELRNDVGQLWENFLVMERLKKQKYMNIYSNNFFWRTWEQQEIDFIEERDGKLFGYEFKYKKIKSSPPKVWSSTYPESVFEVITENNFESFIA